MLRLLRGYGASASLRKLLLVASLAALASFAGPAVADTPTVVALGDSLTAGYGLPTEDGFVPRLQRWLTDHGTAAVLVNAGVSGDTTAGGLARTDWTLTPDVGGLIVTLGGNDLLRGLAPEEARANLDAILAKAQARKLPVLLIGLVAPGNYGPAYKAAFDAIYPDLAAKYATLYVRNFRQTRPCIGPENADAGRRDSPQCQRRGAYCRSVGARGSGIGAPRTLTGPYRGNTAQDDCRCDLTGL